MAISEPIFVTFYWVDTELWDFKPLKIGQNLHANMEGFRRDSHILLFSCIWQWKNSHMPACGLRGSSNKKRKAQSLHKELAI